MDASFYIPRKSINIEKDDFRISLVGKIIEVGENYFVLEDEFGRVKINHNINEENLKKLRVVKAFCTKIDNEIFCDFLQNVEGLDLKLSKKIEDLYLKFL